MTLPSASRLDLAQACLYPWTGGVAWPPRAPETEDQLHGIRVHAAAAAIYRGQDVQLSGLPERTVACIMRLADQREADGEVEVLAIEQRFRLDPERRTVETRAGRYSYEIRGDADLVMRRADGTVVVRDWKTGRRAMTGRVEESLQVAFYATCAAHRWSASTYVVELAYVGEDDVRIDRAELDAMDIGATWATLADLAARARGVSIPRLGSHCRDHYCPIAAVCPATLALAARIETEVGLPHIGTTIETEEQVALVLERAPLVRAYADALLLAAERRLAQLGTATGTDGARWGIVEHQGTERLDVELAAPVLARHGLEAAIEVERNATKTSIDRALRVACGGRGMTKRRLPLLDELRAAGALTRGAPYTKAERIDR